MSQTLSRPPLYKGFRFPPEIISHGVWLYYRFGVSLRDVSELLLARGIEVSYKAIRLWTVRFGLVCSAKTPSGPKRAWFDGADKVAGRRGLSIAKERPDEQEPQPYPSSRWTLSNTTRISLHPTVAEDPRQPLGSVRIAGHPSRRPDVAS
jgi:hypothetical protein